MKRVKDSIVKNKSPRGKNDIYFGYTYTDEINKNGNKVRKKFQGATRQEVEAKLTAFHNNNFPKEIDSIIFSDCYEYLKKIHNNKKAKTITLYETIWNNQVKPFFKNKKAVNILPKDVQNAIKFWTERYSVSTSKKAFSISRKAFELVNMDFGNQLINPFDKIRFSDFSSTRIYDGLSGNPYIKTPDREKYFSDDEMRRIIEELKNTKYPEIPSLLWELPLRINELFALEWSDIDFSTNLLTVNKTLSQAKVNGKWTIEISDGKTAAARRVIALVGTTRRKFLEIKEREKNDNCNLVFHTANMTPVSHSNYSRSFRRAIKRIGITGTIHMIRHTAITNLLDCLSYPSENHVSIHDIATVSGHSDAHITALYDEEHKSKARRVGAAFEETALIKLNKEINKKTSTTSLKSTLINMRNELPKKLYVKFDNGQYAAYNRQSIVEYFIWKFDYFSDFLQQQSNNGIIRFRETGLNENVAYDSVEKTNIAVINFVDDLIDEKYTQYSVISDEDMFDIIEEANRIENELNANRIKTSEEQPINVVGRVLPESKQIQIHHEIDSIRNTEAWRSMHINPIDMSFIEPEFQLFINYSSSFGRLI